MGSVPSRLLVGSKGFGTKQGTVVDLKLRYRGSVLQMMLYTGSLVIVKCVL
jgi:hypothetical protein